MKNDEEKLHADGAEEMPSLTDERLYAGCLSTAMVDFLSYEDRVPCGRLRLPLYEREFFFRGLDQMLLIMDDVMNLANQPWPSLERRHIVNEHYQFQPLDPAEQARRFPMAKRDMSEAGRLIVIRVYYRQQSSMQGELAAEGEKVHFRSALELIRLLHELLDERWREA